MADIKAGLDQIHVAFSDNCERILGFNNMKTHVKQNLQNEKYNDINILH